MIIISAEPSSGADATSEPDASELKIFCVLFGGSNPLPPKSTQNILSSLATTFFCHLALNPRTDLLSWAMRGYLSLVT